jgi:hypothetical protein
MSMHPTRNLFAEFKGNNRVFIETGSFRGDGIQLALDAGYEEIISVDHDAEAINFCISRFDLYGNSNQGIRLVQGDSAECLFDIIKDIHEPVTFWLDSHWQMLEGTEPGINPWPLLNELKQIGKHFRKDHAIIIDDYLWLTHPKVTGWTDAIILHNICNINQDYRIEYFANPIIHNILVAHL